MMAETYRSRTYLRPLDRTPVLKTGRHTGDETFPFLHYPSIRRRSSEGRKSANSLNIVRHKMVDVQFQRTLIAVKFSRSFLLAGLMVLPEKRPQKRKVYLTVGRDDSINPPAWIIISSKVVLSAKANSPGRATSPYTMTLPTSSKS